MVIFEGVKKTDRWRYLSERKGAKIIGYTSTKGYNFENSRAQRGDKFVGLALDFENQAKKNKERIKKWVEEIKAEFA